MSAASFCRNCGKALTEEEKSKESIYCAECAPAAEAAAARPSAPAPVTPYGVSAPPAPSSGISPGLAFLLGLIPGVGAIYNGQYAKGLIHVIVFGLLVSLASSDEATRGLEPLFGMLVPAWVFYMAFEAYHTAKKRLAGEAVDEFSSVFPQRHRGFPAGPILMIAAGVMFLLHNLGVFRIHMMLKWWPVLLIAFGVYLLYTRLTQSGDGSSYHPEVSHERR